MNPVAHASTRSAASSPLRRIYGRAPVEEAILEFRFPALASGALAAIERIGAAESSRYPEVAKIFKGGPSVTVDATGAPPAATANEEHIGFAYRGNGELFFARLDRFEYHKVEPYTQWEDWREEARRLWQIFVAAVTPARISRIGLRYINRLTFPQGAEVKDYLLTAPDLAPRLPQALSGFMMQLNIPHPDLPGGMLIIREGMVPPIDEVSVSVLLDIDVFQFVDVAGDTDAPWIHAEEIHARQNEAFELSITDRTREIIS